MPEWVASMVFPPALAFSLAFLLQVGFRERKLRVLGAVSLGGTGIFVAWLGPLSGPGGRWAVSVAATAALTLPLIYAAAERIDQAWIRRHTQS